MRNFYKNVSFGSCSVVGNLFLAPAAGWSDAAFRLICSEQGAGFLYTALVSAEAIVRKSQKTDVLLLRGAPKTTPYAIQLFGAEPETLAAAVAAIAPYRPDAVDLNAGCPAPKVTKTGAGSALMKSPQKIAAAVKAMRRASIQHLGGVPITVKMRSGWDEANLNFVECAKAAEDAGASLICLHPRTRAQGYSGKSRWDYIAALKQELTIPIAGSGDLETPEDAKRMFLQTGCDCVMFARGAFGNPFIFRVTKEYLQTGAYTEPSQKERVHAALKHLDLLCAIYGEKTACLEMRKIFCAYIKGADGAAELRRKIVCATSATGYRQILAPFC
ncbi:MAG: tRNA dihydrouridine synthase DusB [Spirochaetaceae bacterium]|jgi:nifR3 family TIM-barrel protein|nr:tRNA dihydrouridine synthase DusB [Spirochaetaceae bacterium]